MGRLIQKRKKGGGREGNLVTRKLKSKQTENAWKNIYGDTAMSSLTKIGVRRNQDIANRMCGKRDRKGRAIMHFILKCVNSPSVSCTRTMSCINWHTYYDPNQNKPEGVERNNLSLAWEKLSCLTWMSRKSCKENTCDNFSHRRTRPNTGWDLTRKVPHQ